MGAHKAPFFIYNDFRIRKPMFLRAVLLASLIVAPIPTFAQSVRVYGEGECYRVYEEYVPGYYNRYGQYVGGFVRTNRVRVPCYPVGYISPTYIDVDSCIDRRGIVGGLLGALFGC